MRELVFEGIPNKIISWAENVEEKTIEQAKNLAMLPMVVGHIALMPDAHLGMGMPIGGVIALYNAIIPDAVGSDCGCGVGYARSNFKGNIDKVTLENLIHQIQRDIPTGFHHRGKPVEMNEMPDINKQLLVSEFLAELIPDGRKQLGTLGQNNHFLELQRNELGELCIMVHSGSRNLGKKVCDRHNEIAEGIHKKWHIPHPDKLAWLPADSPEGIAYINDMNYCIDFACRNRKKMLDIIKEDIAKIVNIEYVEERDIHHNYASLEHHMGIDVWVHRKGATSAREGQLGIIPGSMGTKSYIVKGLGNPISFNSCSHGAGRNSSRTEYNKTHTIEQADKEMEGIVHSSWGKDREGRINLSEAPSAYKDIDEVMDNQKDLVDIIHTLKPIACIKG